MQFGAIIGFARVPLYSKLVLNFCPLPSFSFMLNVTIMWREGILMIVRRYLETPALLLVKKKKKNTINREVGALKQLSGRDVNAHTIDVWG